MIIQPPAAFWHRTIFDIEVETYHGLIPHMAIETNSVCRIDPAELPGEEVIFGSTAAMRAIHNRIDSVLSSDLPVLIQGENGTGKKVLARFLQSRSHRHVAPFVRLNCAVAPASLLETEIFGCASGIIAGSRDARQGLIAIAEGGALFLDEIAIMLWDLQGKLRELENWVARAIVPGNEFADGSKFSRQGAAGSTLNRRAPRLRANRRVRRKTTEKLNLNYRSLLNKLREARVPRHRRAHRGASPAH